MKTLYDIANGIDIFGKSFNLNFHKKWERYTTVPGALFTVILYIFSFFYLYILLSAMTERKRNSINSLTSETPVATMGNVSLSQTGVLFFGWIQADQIYKNSSI
jgi:hypothetical protein